jgi:MFS family permease
MRRWHQMFKSLSIRNYRLFFAGNVVSMTGSWLQLTAMPWLVYTLTNSPQMLGLVAFLDQVFILLVSPIAGSIADARDRKKLILMTQTSLFLTTFLLAVLSIGGFLQVWHIVVLAVINGIVNAFDMTFRQSFVLDLVPRENVMNAVGLNSLVFNTSRVIGPSLAGIIIAQISIGICFLLNSFSYLFSIAALLAMKLKKQQIKKKGFSFQLQISEGIEFIKSEKSLGFLMIQLVYMGILLASLMVLIPIYVKNIYVLGAQGLGLFMSSIGAGALLATIVIASRTSMKGVKENILYASVAAGFGVFLFGAVTVNVYVSCAFLMITGFAMVLMTGLANSLIQISAPSQSRGTILGFFMSIFGIAPAGSIISGWTAAHFSPQITAVFGGLIAIFLGAALRKKILD